MNTISRMERFIDFFGIASQRINQSPRNKEKEGACLSSEMKRILFAQVRLQVESRFLLDGQIETHSTTASYTGHSLDPPMEWNYIRFSYSFFFLYTTMDFGLDRLTTFLFASLSASYQIDHFFQ